MVEDDGLLLLSFLELCCDCYLASELSAFTSYGLETSGVGHVVHSPLESLAFVCSFHISQSIFLFIFNCLRLVNKF